MESALLVIGIALGAGLASPLGGLIALWRTPSSFFTSIVVGYAGGVLLGTVGFEMMPKALMMSSLVSSVAGFLAGVSAVYAFDLFINRGEIAGAKADERKEVAATHARHRPRGSRVTVLAGGTSVEELIEGLSIGVGAAIDPGLGMIVGLSIAIDNLSEALSIGTLIRSEEKNKERRPWLRVLGWTSLIGAALIVSALAGRFLLGGLSPAVLGPLLAAGAGGMFYLTVASLIPEAEERHYQQSAGLALAAGFMTVFVLSNV